MQNINLSIILFNFRIAKPWRNKNSKYIKVATMQPLLHDSSAVITGNCWPPTGTPRLVSLGTASQRHSLVAKWERTCAVGTPSECGCLVHQLALRAQGSGKDQFNISSHQRIQGKLHSKFTKLGNFSIDMTSNWEMSEKFLPPSAQKLWEQPASLHSARLNSDSKTYSTACRPSQSWVAPPRISQSDAS